MTVAPTHIADIMQKAPVIPVIVIDDVKHAMALAQALVDGGLPVLEVTLRTEAAIEAISEMKQIKGAIVGAGTVNDPGKLDAALKIGAEFIVSPGLSDSVTQGALEAKVPYLPGVANAGDIMRALEKGLTHLKFFPAMAAGGLPALKALAGPFPDVRFCPTGGITLENAPEWLACDPVLCVGGSWIAPRGETDFDKVRELAKQAAGLA